MASRALESAEVEEMAFFAEGASLSVPVRASLICRVVVLSRPADTEFLLGCECDREEGSCLVGAAWAVALEAAAVLSVCGIWDLFHLLR
jgi:hypothetical protein